MLVHDWTRLEILQMSCWGRRLPPGQRMRGLLFGSPSCYLVRQILMVPSASERARVSSRTTRRSYFNGRRTDRRHRHATPPPKNTKSHRRQSIDYIDALQQAESRAFINHILQSKCRLALLTDCSRRWCRRRSSSRNSNLVAVVTKTKEIRRMGASTRSGKGRSLVLGMIRPRRI